MTILLPVLPEIVLLAAACAILLIDVSLSDERRHVSFWLTQITLLACAWITLTTARVEPVRILDGLVIDDMLSDILKFFSYIAISLMLFYSRGYLAAPAPPVGGAVVLSVFLACG